MSENGTRHAQLVSELDELERQQSESRKNAVYIGWSAEVGRLILTVEYESELCLQS
jgi:hypothetical protein